MQFIETKNAPLPGGHYSQAVVSNGFVFISGQLPINPVTKEKITGSITDQTKQVIENTKSILESVDCNLNNIVKTTVYVSDIELWDSVNDVYKSFFKEHKPARAVVPTRELHFGFKIEMDAIAVK